MKFIDPPQDSIFESNEPFKDFFFQDHRGWTVPDTDKIKSLALRYDFVLVNCSAEHWGSERDFPLVVRLHDLLVEYYGKSFVCLCHDPYDQHFRPNIMYFPWFCWYQSRSAVSEKQITNRDRTFLFSNLNHYSRDFRIANYLALVQKPWAKRCLLTMHNREQQNHDYDGYFPLTERESLAWNDIKLNLPGEVSDGFVRVFATAHPAFADTYLHIVSESTVKDKIFLTEKTWQPILAGQLFVIWGNRGIVAHLRDLGVDVFDDIVDHAYDGIENHRQRLHCLHQELDRLSSLDWHGIYQTTAHRRLRNSSAFVAGQYASPFLDRLKKILRQGSL